ncbi:YscQ/HrcQ family type III secretion apparatus protein [Yokenella regensburgei]|uniref:YscQ/HrcQ family type III secretion apparatus protein n=1 Tax=Yokenella regensburgei TaxID=158877 RepID=UPI0014328579|nr:YscQ/HrcQ family type III secretion apparatus protein [Yokenella regensburgei]QIU92577.1 YscQ/HrcQ family type III secretion apparatus protein [Yokenella regensburgei]
MLPLKQIDKSTHALRRAADTWHQRGHDVSLEYPTRDGLWLALNDSERRWHGWLRLRDWLDYAAPELAGFALSAGFDKLVVQWLAAVEQPLVFPIPELAYQRLFFGEVITGDSLPQKIMLRVKVESGSLWFERVPVPIINHGEAIPVNISWPVRFIIGESTVSSALLKRVVCGDVLLITTFVYEVRCYTKKMGIYKQSEEGIIMDASISLETPAVQDEMMVVRNIEQLPVKIEFVLHTSLLTLNELKSLYQAKLFALPVGVERNVEIRSNGVLLGYGELVELEGQLGVDINEWVGEVYNGE